MDVASSGSPGENNRRVALASAGPGIDTLVNSDPQLSCNPAVPLHNGNLATATTSCCPAAKATAGPGKDTLVIGVPQLSSCPATQASAGPGMDNLESVIPQLSCNPAVPLYNGGLATATTSCSPATIATAGPGMDTLVNGAPQLNSSPATNASAGPGMDTMVNGVPQLSCSPAVPLYNGGLGQQWSPHGCSTGPAPGPGPNHPVDKGPPPSNPSHTMTITTTTTTTTSKASTCPGMETGDTGWTYATPPHHTAPHHTAPHLRHQMETPSKASACPGTDTEGSPAAHFKPTEGAQLPAAASETPSSEIKAGASASTGQTEDTQSLLQANTKLQQEVISHLKELRDQDAKLFKVEGELQDTKYEMDQLKVALKCNAFFSQHTEKANRFLLDELSHLVRQYRLDSPDTTPPTPTICELEEMEAEPGSPPHCYADLPPQILLILRAYHLQFSPVHSQIYLGSPPAETWSTSPMSVCSSQSVVESISMPYSPSQNISQVRTQPRVGGKERKAKLIRGALIQAGGSGTDAVRIHSSTCTVDSSGLFGLVSPAGGSSSSLSQRTSSVPKLADHWSSACKKPSECGMAWQASLASQPSPSLSGMDWQAPQASPSGMTWQASQASQPPQASHSGMTWQASQASQPPQASHSGMTWQASQASQPPQASHSGMTWQASQASQPSSASQTRVPWQPSQPSPAPQPSQAPLASHPPQLAWQSTSPESVLNPASAASPSGGKRSSPEMGNSFCATKTAEEVALKKSDHTDGPTTSDGEGNNVETLRRRLRRLSNKNAFLKQKVRDMEKESDLLRFKLINEDDTWAQPPVSLNPTLSNMPSTLVSPGTPPIHAGPGPVAQYRGNTLPPPPTQLLLTPFIFPLDPVLAKVKAAESPPMQALASKAPDPGQPQSLRSHPVQASPGQVQAVGLGEATPPPWQMQPMGLGEAKSPPAPQAPAAKVTARGQPQSFESHPVHASPWQVQAVGLREAKSPPPVQAPVAKAQAPVHAPPWQVQPFGAGETKTPTPMQPLSPQSHPVHATPWQVQSFGAGEAKTPTPMQPLSLQGRSVQTPAWQAPAVWVDDIMGQSAAPEATAWYQLGSTPPPAPKAIDPNMDPALQELELLAQLNFS